MSVDEKINKLTSMFGAGCFVPFIKYIRFPYIKNLEPGLKVSFDFPVTALVGQNGTNKSAVLRALYGSPNDYSLGSFWFSTAMDPIDESGGRPRFIYSYYQPEAKRDVEVIKTRIRYVYRNNKNVNPDYWEPSRPLLRDGMEKMPPLNEVSAGRDKTRWNLIDKNVVFLDFRSKISAFDKYFYHGDLKKTLRHNSKQDVIRSRSTHLKQVVDSGASSKKMYRGQKEQVIDNRKLCDEKVCIISRILDRDYESVRVVKHRFFKAVGESVVLTMKGLQYSEAFAGSGEFAVVMLVDQVFDASPSSLILLDEPEVSLHPGAQDRLVEFLFEQTIKGRHQIVLGTHSPFVIRRLPKEAIKTLYLDPASNKVNIINETLPSEAFFHLGVHDNGKLTIFVEDRLAKEVVISALRGLGEALYNKFTITYPPGGASAILGSYLVAYARTARVDALFFMDGDQRCDGRFEFDRDLKFLTAEELSSAVTSVIGFMPKLETDGGGEKRNEQIRDAHIAILEYAEKYLNYLPSMTPEEFIWENMDFSRFGIAKSFCYESSYKEKFRALCIKELGREDFEDVDSNEIFEIQKLCLATINKAALSEVQEVISSFASG